ncbi:eukaryotic translation initiation factor 4 gamma 1 [Archocentrus centrarchus]|uniref:eukaryotic translation initiation factor 4 gamma 1 n=1 Tax=Archocentrus centrarchus TaxID=63155 RepID=UPI0011EA4D4E|nr:eukaryotic translation initiation factor 4 gamma 1 [Archocentrus centrarchus]
MSKAPQPITGPPPTPHTAPSPGLPQAPFPPGQSVVFATQPPQQMNPTPQPRQFAPGPRPIHQQGSFRSLQPYYPNRASLPPSSGPRGVPPSSGPRPVTPTHVYQAGPGSQMMMIPQQQLPFPSSPQGPAYIIPGQYRSPTYVATAQQYSVAAGTPSFYPSTSPAEYGTYAGAYYPAQPQFTPSVQAGPVIMNPPPQQQPPPQPAQHIPTKRERKQIRIRDPNQGGRDITEEIMSGGRSGSTPTPPQTAISGSESTSVTQANGESVPAAATPALVRPDDRRKPTPPPLAKTPELPKGDSIPTEANTSDTNTKTPLPPLLSEAENTPENTISTLAPNVPVPDVMDAPAPRRDPTPPPQSAPEVPAYPAPFPDLVLTSSAQNKTDKKATEAEEEVTKEEVAEEEEAKAEKDVMFLDTPQTPPSSTNGVTELEPERLSVELPPSHLEDPLESPIAQPEELRLPNGLPLPAPQDPEAPADSAAEHDDSPIAEPDVSQQPISHTSAASTQAAPHVEAIPPPVEHSTPAPTVQEAEPPQAAPIQPEAHDPVPAVTLDVKEDTPVPQSNTKEETPSPTEMDSIADSTPEAVPTPPPTAEEREDTPPPPQTVTPAPVETTMQAAVSVPKKKRKMKDLNKKEAVGDLLDAFKEAQKVVPPEPEPAPAPEPQPPTTAAPPAQEEADLTWEDKEDKLDAENIQPDPTNPTATDKKYQYKEEQWKPINTEEKKKYDREFLLGFQFISASMNKPLGLPAISDVVLDKANKTPLRQLDPSRLPGMNCGPDFTPSFANLGRPSMGGGGRGPPPGMGMGIGGPRRSQQVQRKEPRKIITSMSLNDDVQLNKAEKAWKSSVKKVTRSRGAEEIDESDPEHIKTQELFKRVRSILNKLTPQKFQQLMKQVTELTIDTEERLKGVIDLTFEKAISEPDFSVAYANMCRCLMGLRVEIPDKPGATVNFRKLLLNRCQKEFEKDKDDDEIFEKKQKELEAASGEEEKQRLIEELEEAKDKARRRSLGNIKFIGELFKLKMLTEVIMHDCIVKLLKNHDEESLECLCRLLSTIGKDLDFEKAKPRMDQYFNQMEKIIKERKTTSRIRFMLQDVLDLRRNNWVPRRGDQGPKTIDQIHKDAELEEHREQMKVQQALISKKESSGGSGGRMGGGRRGPHSPGRRGPHSPGRRGPHSPGRRGPHSPGRGVSPQDEGWNTVPISKNRPIDTSRLSKITKTPVLDFNNQLLAPGGKGTWGSWGKGSSGGTSAKPADSGTDSGSRPATSTLNRFSALQQPSSSSGSSLDTDKRVPQRNSLSRERSDRFDRSDRGSDRFERRDDRDRNQLQVTKRSFSREKEERSREREQRSSADPVRRVASMTDERDRGSRERARSGENVKRETAATPPPPQTPTTPALTEEELEKKSTAIIEEYLHINDMKEALQCVQEMNSTQLLFVFVRNGLESTLERSTIAREHMGLLLHQLLKTGILPKEQYYKGLQEILEVAEDMAIDIPHIWLYLAELITPMLHEGGLPMGELFREISKPLIPLGKAGVLLVHILTLLCKEMSHKKAGTMWREAGLRWKDFLPEDIDVNKFVTEKNVEFTLGDESEKDRKKELSATELTRQLDRLIQDKADNQRIFDWIEANLDEQQTSSNMFVRALMTCICQSAIICETPYRVDGEQIKQRAKLLQKYLKDEQKELQALYALQALMVQMEQPANLLRMFFDTLYDEDVIKEEAFYKWESSKDPAEQQGKGVALKSVTAFFTWLREAEDESDNS